MTYTAKITLPHTKLAKALEPELLSTKRSTMIIKDQEVQVTAEDATALRAALVSLTRLIMVYEKAQ